MDDQKTTKILLDKDVEITVSKNQWKGYGEMKFSDKQLFCEVGKGKRRYHVTVTVEE